jgi:hypothetical protein
MSGPAGDLEWRMAITAPFVCDLAQRITHVLDRRA